MNTAWIGVIGAAVGGLIAVVGQWAVQRRVGAQELRAERREAYTDFVASSNLGIRTVRELLKLGDELAEHMDDPSAVEQKHDHDRMKENLLKVRDASEVFLKDMDRNLAGMQLVSPFRILQAGRRLREGIDEYADKKIKEAEVSERYGTFVALAHVDLRSSNSPLLGWFVRALLRRPKQP